MFFEKCQCDPPNLRDALAIQAELNIIPFQHNDLTRKASEFSSLDNCIKQNFSDILLTTMKVLVALFSSEDTDISLKRDIKHFGRCLATFSGMIAYQMPGNYNQEFIRLQAKIS